MKNNHTDIISLIIIVLIAFTTSCEWEEKPGPRVSEKTLQLEAEYSSDKIDGIKSAFWKGADYVEVAVNDLATENVNTETGMFNMNGTFKGLESFNKGDSIKLTVKAGYDDENIYILASWKDSYINASYASLLYNGPSDPLKPGTTEGWTSQRNQDNIVFEFDIPQTQDKDVWKWSPAHSEPLAYAIDMNIKSGGVAQNDAGSPMVIKNTNSNTGKPLYEWNGELQKITTANGKSSILDPAYYILNKTEYKGDAAAGTSVFNKNCAKCHGDDGSGEQSEEHPDVYATPLNNIEWNRDSREALVSKILAEDHDGKSYFEKLTQTQKDDLFARMRSISGIPGYYISEPSGSLIDVITFSNLNTSKIKARSETGEYQVLFVRKLNTGNSDDIIFKTDGTNEYKFTIKLSDNDDINYIGSINNLLIFK